MSVTLVDVDATWVNPDTVTYDAGELRRADAAMFASAGIVRTSDSSLRVSVDGSDLVTVQQGSWVIPGNAVVGSGVWRGGIAAAVTGNLEARDATNGRIDLVVARQLDTDVVGTHSAYTGRIEIITGAPSATPGVPVLPSMAVELARVTVPKSGGGAATVDLSHRTYATAIGGVIVVPSSARLPASAATGQRAYVLDKDQDYRYDGAAWQINGNDFWNGGEGSTNYPGGLAPAGARKVIRQGTLVATVQAGSGTGFWSIDLSAAFAMPSGLVTAIVSPGDDASGLAMLTLNDTLLLTTRLAGYAYQADGTPVPAGSPIRVNFYLAGW